MRTFTMTLVGAASLTVAAVLVYFFVRVVLPALASDETAAAFIPIFAVFVGVLTILGTSSLLWQGARTRAWFWGLVAGVGVLFLIMFGAEIAFSLGQPAEPRGFIPSLFAMAAAIVIVIGGIVAFLEVRRGRTMASTRGRAGWFLAGLGGLLLGAGLTSWIAGAASASGGTVSDAPTATAILVAESTRFDQSSLSIGSGQALGLFLVNRDSTAHSFDIASLGVHVAMPPDSTTVVTITAANAGQYEFYCAVLGHRGAGMVGTLMVEEGG
jgi:plastocyanin